MGRIVTLAVVLVLVVLAWRRSTRRALARALDGLDPADRRALDAMPGLERLLARRDQVLARAARASTDVLDDPSLRAVARALDAALQALAGGASPAHRALAELLVDRLDDAVRSRALTPATKGQLDAAVAQARAAGLPVDDA
jgi:hypothetical protein